jgi:hypothetical protein
MLIELPDLLILGLTQLPHRQLQFHLLLLLEGAGHEGTNLLLQEQTHIEKENANYLFGFQAGNSHAMLCEES